MQQIPKADLNEFLSGNQKQKESFVNKIGEAFQEIGFLALKGHFLDDKLQDLLYKETVSYTHLTLPTKA